MGWIGITQGKGRPSQRSPRTSGGIPFRAITAAAAVVLSVVARDVEALEQAGAPDADRPTIAEIEALVPSLVSEMREDFSKGLVKQNLWAGLLDSWILGHLRKGSSTSEVNRSLARIEDTAGGTRMQRYDLYQLREGPPAVMVAAYQADINGPSVFRVIVGAADDFTLLYRSEQDLETYALTYYALEVIPFGADGGRTLFGTVSGGTDSGVHRTLIIWEYDASRRQVWQRVELARKAHFSYLYDRRANSLRVEYCECQDPDYLTECRMKIEEVYDIGKCCVPRGPGAGKEQRIPSPELQ